MECLCVCCSYAIMTDCWHEVPERRPTFTDLVNHLELLLNPPKKHQSGVPETEEEPTYINVADSEARDYLHPINSASSPVAWRVPTYFVNLLSASHLEKSPLWNFTHYAFCFDFLADSACPLVQYILCAICTNSLPMFVLRSAFYATNDIHALYYSRC